MTDWPELWRAAFHYLAELADAKSSAADYAVKIHMLYDALAEETGDPGAAREFLEFHVSMQQDRQLISAQHLGLAFKLLPKPPRQKRGRPKGALGEEAYNERYELYQDWIYKKTFNPSLSKGQFTKERLGITKDQFDADYNLDDPNVDGPLRMKVAALLQDLKPARMKALDEGQRRYLETIYPLVITYPRHLAQKWREAKQRSPALTKEEFLQDFFGWPRERKRHTSEAAIIRDYLQKLDQGEKLLTNGERG